MEDKDSENTKRSTKVASEELSYEYLKEKNIQEPHDKKELGQVLKSFYNAIMGLSLFSLKQCIIKQLLDSASADITYLDLDYSGYHKNLIQ